MTINLNKKAIVVALFAISAFFLSGCYPHEERYLSRQDSITANLGDAVNTNKATHTVNPWPKGVRNTKIKHDGKVGADSVDRYQKDEVKGYTEQNEANSNGTGITK